MDKYTFNLDVRVQILLEAENCWGRIGSSKMLHNFVVVEFIVGFVISD